MSTDYMATTVEGESIEVLFEALLRFRMVGSDERGMVEVEAQLPPEIGGPFFRALMRVEADLLVADANALGTDSYEERSHEQRCHDALIELVRRMHGATKLPTSSIRPEVQAPAAVIRPVARRRGKGPRRHR